MVRGYLNIRSNIAQVILVVLLLPFLAVVCWIVCGSNAAPSFDDFLLSLIGQIPLCDVWFEILAKYAYSAGITQQQLVDAVPVVMLRSIPETILLGVCVHACNQIFRLLQGPHGLPIFSTFIGVVLSSGLTYLTGLSSDILYEIGADIVLIIGIVVLVRVVFGLNGRSVFGISKIFVIVIDALLGIIVCAYICFLLMVSLGYYGSPEKAVGSFLILTGIVLLAAVLRYIVSLGEDSFV